DAAALAADLGVLGALWWKPAMKRLLLGVVLMLAIGVGRSVAQTVTTRGHQKKRPFGTIQISILTPIVTAIWGGTRGCAGRRASQASVAPSPGPRRKIGRASCRDSGWV